MNAVFTRPRTVTLTWLLAAALLLLAALCPASIPRHGATLTGADGREVDVWATPKDRELADNFVKNSAGEWEARGEQERHRTFTDRRLINDYFLPAMQRAEDSTMAFVEINVTIATVMAGGAGVSGLAPKVIAMGREAVSELTGVPTGLKDLKDGVVTLVTRNGFKHVDEVTGAAKTLPAATQPNRIYSARELIRRADEPGPFHNYPESFNKQIFESGNRTVTPDFFNKARQGLSNDSIQYRLPGTVNGRDGMFEIFTRPSTSGNTEVIMHRFFNPKP